jgi:hypothetical protein
MATLKTSKNRVREESEAEQGWVQMGCQSFQNVVVDSEGVIFRQTISTCPDSKMHLRVHHHYLKQ